jgi:hypothetical protein
MSGPAVIKGDVLEKDAEAVWQAGSDKLTAMARGIPTIAAADFSCVPGGPDAARLYGDIRTRLMTYIEDGAREFLDFEHLLLEAVLVYYRAENASQEDIARIEKELET